MITPIGRFAVYATIVSQLMGGVAGCRQEGKALGAGGRTRAGNAASGQTQSSTLGELAYRILRRNLEISDPSDNPAGKVAALDARKVEFVAAIDTIIPPSMSSSLPSTLDDVARMVDDGTLPTLTDNIASILELLASDPQDPQQVTLNALSKMAQTRAPISRDQALKLGGRLLAYPELNELLKAISAVMQENDGLAADGRPNQERDLLGEDIALLAKTLRDLARPAAGSTPSSSAPSALTTALLEGIELRGGLQVGSPAWATRADANGNAKVKVDPSTGRIYAPFIDQNRDGVADVNAAGDPIDASGLEIALAPFGNDGLRDADGKAIDAQGRPIFDYFDAKKTALGQTALLAGKLVERDVPLDLLKSIDQASTRAQGVDASGTFVGYADDNPLTDVAWAGLEIFRYRDAPKLLSTAAQVIKNDPRNAERILVHLVNVIDIIDRTPAQGAAQGGRSMLDDMVPLLDKVFESNGQGNADSVAKDVLGTFRTQFQTVRQIPHDLAEMMKYSDYPSRRPVGPGEKSCLEQLMDMMAEANQCDSWPFGNMAEFYLDAMAGNKSILGLTINVHTINQLLDIPFLRSLLCSQISASNIRALQAFADSGALNSLTPIVKAFSNRGQTKLIKNIFLTLGANYPTALRPNEGVLVQVLESGIAEEVLDSLNQMASMTVPGTGEPVNDVIAQFLAAVVDVNRVVRDRRGTQVMSLLHLLLRPLDAMSQRIDARGVRATYDRAIHNTIEVALQTTQIDTGTSQQPRIEDGLLYNGLIKVAAAALDTASKGMSMDPATRNTDITRYQGNVVSLMTGREIPLAVDTLLAVDRSQSRARILSAIVNVFTPNLQAQNDIYGSVLELGAAVLQARSVDPAATVDVLRFAGKALDPARGFSKPIVRSLMKLLAGQRNTTVTTILRNALDKGPTGASRSPLESVLSVFDDVSAQSTKPSNGSTPQGIADQVSSIASFLRDKDKGLVWIYGNLRGRAH